MAIDLNQLRVFVAVAELGSMTRAAKSLKMPVSRVSRTIGRLEAGLGASLILRTTRSLTVTEAGKRLHQATRPLMQRLGELEDEFHTDEGAVCGLVRVTAPEDFGGAIVARLLAELSGLYPKLALELHCSDEFVDLVQAGIDVGLRFGKLADSTLKAKRLGTAQFICVATPHYLSRVGVPKEPQDLLTHDCIHLILGPADRRKTWDLSNGRQRVAVAVTPRLRANHTGAAIGFAMAHCGITLVPAPMVAEPLRSGALVRVLPAWSLDSIPVHLIYPAQKNLPARVKVVVDFLTERLGSYF